MIEQRVPSDVFYDQGDGEFQMLSSDLIGELDAKIIETLPSIHSMTYDDYQLNERVNITTGSVDLLDAAVNEAGDPVLVETQLSVIIMHRRMDAIEKIVVVATAQRIRLDQSVLHHDHRELHTLTETYVTEPLRERYVIYRYVDGSYAASVEQYNLLEGRGSLAGRPMTLYDSGELLVQLDDAAIRSLDTVTAVPPR